MKLEALVVCINYSDFLKVTLPANKNMFDKLVVITDNQDSETKLVCEFYNVQCIQTNDFYDTFDECGKPVGFPNKAKGINVGLNALAKDGWVLQMDADIWLPPLTRNILETLSRDGSLDIENIYGIDRLMCNSYKDWYEFLYKNSRPIHEGWIYLHLDNFPIGERIIQYHGEGYMPIGYFQLWHPGGSSVSTYPEINAAFDRTDVLHLKQFPRTKRKFLPELICIHLASQKHEQGQNWKGRTTQGFLPDSSVFDLTPANAKKATLKKVKSPGRIRKALHHLSNRIRRIFTPTPRFTVFPKPY